MKPILFNTEMVRAIMSGRKTVTRRVVKYTVNDVYDFACVNGMWDETYDPQKPPQKLVDRFVDDIAKPPYRFGDILYVRETFFEHNGTYYYKADGKHEALDLLIGGSFFKWRPSIHMHKEAARLFLRVTDVRVERVQDIKSDGAVDEGAVKRPNYTKRGDLVLHNRYRDEFVKLWDSTIKPADRAVYGWAANPLVWVIEFERITKEEAENG